MVEWTRIWAPAAVVMVMMVAFGSVEGQLDDVYPSRTTHGLEMGFGSCNKAPKTGHNAFKAMTDNTVSNASSWSTYAWLGDAVYGDHNPIPFLWLPAEPQMLRDKFAELKRMDDYAALVERVPVVGTWDDHDFGANDGGAWYQHKRDAQVTFLDFLGVSPDSPRRDRTGVYSAIGLQASSADSLVVVILLDVRTHADIKGNVILGDEQWAWLESVLDFVARDPRVVLTLVGSGTQVLPLDKVLAEGWHHVPHERTRLLDALVATGVPSVFLSGDVHFSEVSHTRHCTSSHFADMYDVTSSGLTHTWGDKIAPLRAFLLHFFLVSSTRIGDPILDHSFGSFRLADDADGKTISFTFHHAHDGSIIAQHVWDLQSLTPKPLPDHEEERDALGCSSKIPSESLLRNVTGLQFGAIIFYSCVLCLGWVLTYFFYALALYLARG